MNFYSPEVWDSHVSNKLCFVATFLNISRAETPSSCSRLCAGNSGASKDPQAAGRSSLSRRCLLRQVAVSVASIAALGAVEMTGLLDSASAAENADDDIASAKTGNDVEGEQDSIDLADASSAEPPITAKVYFDLSVKGAPARRIIVGCFGTIAPNTVANFIELANRSPDGGGGYALTEVYRVVPGLTVQMGDVLRNGGRSGRASNGSSLPAETYRLLHTVPGVVSMARGPGGTIDSRFFVTTRPGDSSYLDAESRKYVAFGRILSGFEVLLDFERIGSRGGDSRPKLPIVITRCGTL